MIAGSRVPLCAAIALALPIAFLWQPCASSLAYADAALRVDTRIECLTDGLGQASIPTATLENLTDFDITITQATPPDRFSWTCDAQGKTIPAHETLHATWTAVEALPESALEGLSSTEPRLAGQFTYYYALERPLPKLSGSIAIDGKRITGSTLSARAIDAPANAMLSWQWYRDDTAIDDATSQQFTLAEGDDEHSIECRARDASGSYAGDIRCDADEIAPAFYSGYTMDEVKAMASDIARNGTSSRFYGEMAQGLADDAVGTMRLRNGELYHFRLAGILHDDAASGGKAGLTFVGCNALPIAGQMNLTDTNDGGWESCALRASLNSGEHWMLFSDEFHQSVCAVEKSTKNACGTDRSAPATATSDMLWLPSMKEIVGTLESYLIRDSPALDDEGEQYACFKPHYATSADRAPELIYAMVVTNNNQMAETCRGMLMHLRSASGSCDTSWYCASQTGSATLALKGSLPYAVTPGWCMGEAS